MTEKWGIVNQKEPVMYMGHVYAQVGVLFLLSNRLYSPTHPAPDGTRSTGKIEERSEEIGDEIEDGSRVWMKRKN